MSWRREEMKMEGRKGRKGMRRRIGKQRHTHAGGKVVDKREGNVKDLLKTEAT